MGNIIWVIYIILKNKGNSGTFQHAGDDSGGNISVDDVSDYRNNSNFYVFY